MRALERQNFLLRKKLIAHQQNGTQNAYGLHANVIARSEVSSMPATPASTHPGGYGHGYSAYGTRLGGSGMKKIIDFAEEAIIANKKGDTIDYNEAVGHSRTHSRKASRTSAISHAAQGSPWLARPSENGGGADKVLRVPGGHSRHGSRVSLQTQSSRHGSSRHGSRHGSTRATPVLCDPSGPSVSVSPLRDGEKDGTQTEWGAHRGLLGKDWDLIMQDLDIAVGKWETSTKNGSHPPQAPKGFYGGSFNGGLDERTRALATLARTGGRTLGSPAGSVCNGEDTQMTQVHQMPNYRKLIRGYGK